VKKTVRVLVIDDSAYNRRTIVKMLEEIAGVEVIGYATNGEDGLRKVIDLQPDLITLDLEMPRMDGFTFLRILMQNRPTPVIVVSARSQDEDVFKALDFGAVEFIAKPSAKISPELFNIREDLENKVREISRADMNKILGRNADLAQESPEPAPLPATSGKLRFDMVVVGASTGGPQALQTIFSAIHEPLSIGFAVAQHMPPNFTRTFADRLNRFSGMEIREAKGGDIVRPGLVLMTPGGKNLTFRRWGGDVLVNPVDPPPRQLYVPSVDVMFESAAQVYGSRLLGVVLTGMGCDGAAGVRRIKERGGEVLAEAEETSVVFGMPKEAIATGLVDEIVPLPKMCQEILRRCGS
jgi:two-component system, chemotaxis family, protein-glutamate methylesterase/glutaminase